MSLSINYPVKQDGVKSWNFEGSSTHQIRINPLYRHKNRADYYVVMILLQC